MPHHTRLAVGVPVQGAGAFAAAIQNWDAQRPVLNYGAGGDDVQGVFGEARILRRGVFFGRLLGINDLVNFESANAEGLEEEFHKAVDDYLAFCSEIGKQPQTPTI